MRYDVPFRRQDSGLDCGPVNLQMATAFLGDEKSLEEIKKLVDFSDKAVFTIQLATAAERLGFDSTFYTEDLWNEHDEDYYDEYGEDIDNEDLNSEAVEAGVTVVEQELELEELLSFLDGYQIPIVLLDWHVITGEEGYFGHFAVVVGYDDEHVLIHNSDDDNGDYQKIETEVFDRARESDGTDQDIAVISEKK